MVQTHVLSHFDLNTAHEEPIDIPRIPLSRRIAVFVRFVQEPHGNAAAHGSKCGISVSLVSYAIHDDVDLLRFRVHIRSGPKVEVLTIINARWEVELRIDWECWITACQWTTDVSVVSVSDGIGPKVVILLFETLDQRDVVSEVDSFIDVVNEWRVWHEKVGREISSHKFKFALAGKQHHLPMQDTAVHFIAHGNSRGL